MSLTDLQSSALAAITTAADLTALDALRVQYLGGKGQITARLKELGTLDPETRKTRGAEVNILREAVQTALNARKDALETAIMDASLATETVDITLPADRAGFAALGASTAGKIHPLTAAMEEIAASLKTMGFVHAYGPEVETDTYNFTKLNLPPTHPARQDQDTFYVKLNDDEGRRKVLRTQTSNVQIHTLEGHQPPFRVMGIGRVYRRDYDLTHTPQFHQVEGMLVDKGVTMGDMRGVLQEFLRAFFGKT
jgi:phenylalanyl-tRNA synthetase alpha chain